MTVKEIRERLKHIAGLCYGLSADLSSLAAENARLKGDNNGLEKSLKECQQRLAEMRCYQKRKAQKQNKEDGQ